MLRSKMQELEGLTRAYSGIDVKEFRHGKGCVKKTGDLERAAD